MVETDVTNNLKGLHFLVAEDDDLNCEIVKTLLEMEGATCDFF